MKTSPVGIDLIKRFEGCKLEAYLCPAQVWTIGYGHTKGVKKGQRITQLEADELLARDLVAYEAAVAKLAPSATQNQFDALVSFAFNLGVNALTKSTLLRKFKEGKVQEAADEFLKWVNANGQKLPGLVKRREAERALFLS